MAAVQGICNDSSTGQLSITLPDSTSITSAITNPNGVGYVVIVKRNSDGLFITNYSSIFQNTIPEVGAGDLLILTSSSGDVVNISNLAAGTYQVIVRYYDNVYSQNGQKYIPSVHTYAAVSIQNVAINLTSCNTDVYGCTDSAAINYTSTATVDDGSCLYQGADGINRNNAVCPCPPNAKGTVEYLQECCPELPILGCTDPNAENYNPAANADNGSCQYDVNSCVKVCDGVTTTIPACIPNGINNLLEYNRDCIVASGNRFWNKHILGLGDKCSNMDTWKMLIIDDLMSRKGLPCIYNCTDENTPSILDASNDCTESWAKAGKIDWVPADVGTYNINSVVRRKGIDGVFRIYTAVSNSGLNIDPNSNSSSSGWRKCNSLIINSERKEYLPNFLAFAFKYCKDCEIPPYLRGAERKAVKVEKTLNTGGTNIKINGATFII